LQIGTLTGLHTSISFPLIIRFDTEFKLSNYLNLWPLLPLCGLSQSAWLCPLSQVKQNQFYLRERFYTLISRNLKNAFIPAEASLTATGSRHATANENLILSNEQVNRGYTLTTSRLCSLWYYYLI
jgi:hypothetical protein